MLTRMRLVKGATALLYVGPLIAGLGGFGWTMTLPFTAIFVVWLMILRPEQWPASPEEWLTAPAWLAALAQVLSQIVLVAILFGVGRGLGGLADIAGMQPGDQFIDFKTVPEFVEFLEVSKGAEVRIAVKRGGETFPVKFVPRVAVPEGEGNIGVFLDEIGLPKQNFFRSFLEGFKLSLQITKAIFAGIVQLVVGVFTDISILDRFVGPVGIVSVAIGTARAGFVQFLQLLALISLNLAVFNVFPIPALDGGRLFFLMLEKLRGKPINMHTEMVINGVSFFILLILIGAVTVKDIVALL